MDPLPLPGLDEESNAGNGAPLPGLPLAPPAAADPSPPWNRTTKAIVAIFAVVLAAIVLYRFRSLLQPLALAAILAFVLNPAIGWAMRRLRLSRGWAVALVFTTTLLATLAALGLGGYVAFDQTAELIADLPRLLTRASVWAQENLRVFTLSIGPYSFDLNLSPDQFDLGALAEQVFSYLQPALSSSGSWAAQLASATLGAVSTLFVVLMVSVYLAKDSPHFWGALSDVAHVPGYRADVNRLIHEFVHIWDSYLRGQVILGVAMFVIVSVVLSIMGVRYSLGLGLLSGLLEFLPIIGPLIATLAAVLVAFFQEGNNLGLSPLWFGVAVAVVMFALQQLEAAVLVPRFVGNALDLHPVVVIVVVLMGASLAGILGAVLAAPVTATVKLLAIYGWRKLFDLPPFPEPARSPEPYVPLSQRIRERWRRRRGAA